MYGYATLLPVQLLLCSALSVTHTCTDADGWVQVGYPVLLKATGGGGGIGIYICLSKADLVKNFEAAGRCCQ